MERFKYTSNHPCHLSLKVNDEYKEFSLFGGEEYELPEENTVIQRMVAQGLLESSLKSNTVTTINPQLKNKKSNGS